MNNYQLTIGGAAVITSAVVYFHAKQMNKSLPMLPIALIFAAGSLLVYQLRTENKYKTQNA
jgi:hypothetical protein